MVLNFFNFVLKRYWKSVEKTFWKCVWTLQSCFKNITSAPLHSLYDSQSLSVYIVTNPVYKWQFLSRAELCNPAVKQIDRIQLCNVRRYRTMYLCKRKRCNIAAANLVPVVQKFQSRKVQLVLANAEDKFSVDPNGPAVQVTLRSDD